jgi:hypothetical protein
MRGCSSHEKCRHWLVFGGSEMGGCSSDEKCRYWLVFGGSEMGGCLSHEKCRYWLVLEAVRGWLLKPWKMSPLADPEARPCELARALSAFERDLGS